MLKEHKKFDNFVGWGNIWTPFLGKWGKSSFKTQRNLLPLSYSLEVFLELVVLDICIIHGVVQSYFFGPVSKTNMMLYVSNGFLLDDKIWYIEPKQTF